MMPREWSESEKKMLGEFVGATPWLNEFFDHNVSVIPRFFELHPLMSITWATLTIAVQSAELLPDPYQPNALDRLRIGEIVPPPTPPVWSQEPERPVSETEKPKLLNNAPL